MTFNNKRVLNMVLPKAVVHGCDTNVYFAKLRTVV